MTERYRRQRLAGWGPIPETSPRSFLVFTSTPTSADWACHHQAKSGQASASRGAVQAARRQRRGDLSSAQVWKVFIAAAAGATTATATATRTRVERVYLSLVPRFFMHAAPRSSRHRVAETVAFTRTPMKEKEG